MKNNAGYKTAYGECLCIDSLEALHFLEDNSVNLVVTSPPFALQRKKHMEMESSQNMWTGFVNLRNWYFQKKRTGYRLTDAKKQT